MKYFILVFVIIGIVSCGSSSNSDDVTDSVDLSTTEAIEPQVIQTTELFGSNGNLYKPKSDPEGSGQGNLVVLLDSKYTEQFDSCEIQLNTGETAQLICINDQPWSQIPFSCFSNGNRQTWRASFGCNSVAEVKVTCRLPGQDVIFTTSEGQIGWICTRFG